MKRRMISLIAVLCLAAMTFSLVSCGGVTLEDFKKRLGSEYEVDIYRGDSTMQALLEDLTIDTEEFEVTGVLNGEHKEEEHYVGIIECAGNDVAVNVKTTLEARIEELGWRAGGIVVDLDGVFVLFGTRKAVQTARGR